MCDPPGKRAISKRSAASRASANQPALKILVVKPSSLGDILHTFPALAELHAACPEAQVTWVANDSLAQIVRLYPRLEKVIPFPRKALGKFSLRALRGFLHELRSDEYDAVIDFQGLLRSGVITWLAHAKLRIGFSQAREGATFAYHHAVTTPPSMTHAADKNRFLARALLEKLGYETFPAWNAERSDIIQSIDFHDPEKLKRFCAGIQQASPVDSFVTPEPWDMPGYEAPVIMAAGTFVQGASIELSCDGPMLPPYRAYLQGGLTYESGKLSILTAAEKLEQVS